MASLQFVPHPGAAVQSFPLHKRITTIGRSPDNDVSLLQADLLDVHAHIYFDGSHFTLSSMTLNQKDLIKESLSSDRQYILVPVLGEGNFTAIHQSLSDTLKPLP